MKYSPWLAILLLPNLTSAQYWRWSAPPPAQQKVVWVDSVGTRIINAQAPYITGETRGFTITLDAGDGHWAMGFLGPDGKIIAASSHADMAFVFFDEPDCVGNTYHVWSEDLSLNTMMKQIGNAPNMDVYTFHADAVPSLVEIHSFSFYGGQFPGGQTYCLSHSFSVDAVPSHVIFDGTLYPPFKQVTVAE